MLRPVTIVGSIIIFIVSLIILIYSIILKSNIRFDSKILNDVMINWLKSPIYEIQQAENDYCPEGTTFIENGWEGTVTGCDCTHAYFGIGNLIAKEHRLKRVSCRYNETTIGCDEVEAINPIIYETWKGKKLCSWRSNKKNFFDYSVLISKASEGCQDSFKSCGSIDTLHNILCLPNNQTCPINKILIRDKQDIPPFDYEYKKIPLNDNNVLYYTNQATNGRIFVDIISSEAKICSNYMEKEISESYILEKNRPYNCSDWMNDGLSYDYRYTVLDEYNKSSIYKENGILTYIESELPYYPLKINNKNIELLSRPYIGWRKKCALDSTYNINIVFTISNKLHIASTLQNVIWIICTVMFIASIIANIYTCISKSGGSSLSIMLQGLYSLICLIICFLCFFAEKNLLEISLYADEIVLNKCGDELSNSIISYIQRNTHTYSNQIMLILSMIGSFLFPIIYMVKFYNNNSENNRGLQLE